MKRGVLTRCFVSALGAVFVCSALAFSPGGAWAEAMSDSDFALLCGKGTAEQVKQALKDGANPNARAEDGDAALFSALFNENPDVVKALLAAGANPNARNSIDETPLTVAAQGHAPGEIKALLAAGADVNAKAGGNNRALHHAVRKESEGDGCCDDEEEERRLLERYHREWIESVEALLAAGADVNAQNQEGETALMRAVQWSNAAPEIVAALLKAGADRSIRDKAGHDALWHARNADLFEEDGAEIFRLLEGGAEKPAR